MKRALRRARARSRLLLTAAVAILVTAAIPNLAGGGHQSAPPVPSFTGCLSNPEGGRLYNLQVGDGPAGCRAGDPEVHLSGGDITAVGAGPGLEGGTSEGAAVLRLKDQACAGGTAMMTRIRDGSFECRFLRSHFGSIDITANFPASDIINIDLAPQDCPMTSPKQFVTGFDGVGRIKCDFPNGLLPPVFLIGAFTDPVLDVTNNGTGDAAIFTVTDADASAVRVRTVGREAGMGANGITANTPNYIIVNTGGALTYQAATHTFSGPVTMGTTSISFGTFDQANISRGTIGGCSFPGGGTISCPGGKAFRVDHPLDPAKKWLYHAAVEGPELLNVYSGNVRTNARGAAVVRLPRYFQALNRDFRYQLTVIGSFAQAIVAEEIAGNRFTIRTSKPGVKVSWQVTGVRNDAYARSHPFRAEVAKTAAERAASSSQR